MRIITRADAKAEGLSKYFTGEPCKNGHVQQRYTTSGACSGCLLDSSRKSRQELTGVITERRAEQVISLDSRRAALAEMFPLRLRAHAQDWGYLRSVAVAVMQLRYPGVLQETDAHDRKGGKDGKGGTLLYTVLAHPSDHAYLKAEERRLLAARAPNMAEARARAFNIGQTLIAEEIEPVPEFKP